MDRMTGVLLMIVGVISFVLGLVIYGKADKAAPVGVTIPEGLQKTARIKNLYDTVVAQQHKESKLQQAVRVSNSVKAVDKNKRIALEQAIKVAIADGVLTNNERKLIKELSQEIGLDYKQVLEEAEAELSARGGSSETELIDQNKKAGLDFERFVVKRFAKKHFDIVQWTGDKYVDGRFSETNYHPDLLMRLKLSENERFSVECKWRGKFSKEINIGSERQLARYKRYEEEMKVPVFIALGLGGTGESPKEFYIVPLKEIQSGTISMASLKRYEKDLDKMLYYDAEKRVLR